MAEYVIPADRIGVWEANVRNGVIGGIPTYSAGPNIMDYGGVDDGTGNNNSALQSAIAASSNDQAIILPAGTFAFTSAYMDWNFSRRAIRGAGMGATTLKISSGTSGFLFGTGLDYGSEFNPHSTITGGLTKGSTVITVADGSSFVNDRMAKINITNDPDLPVLDVNGYEGKRSFYVWIVSKSGNDLTLSVPLPCDFTGTEKTGATIYQSQLTCQKLVGIEDLTIDASASGGATQNGVNFDGNVYQGWIKNVLVKNYNNYGLKIQNSVCAEIRGCRIDPGYGGGSNRSGLLSNNNSFMLFEDNIVNGAYPGIEVNAATFGSVFAYNYATLGFNINHGAHNSMNLYEGNRAPNVHADGYFGGTSHELFFRNHWDRGSAGTAFCFSLKRATRYHNIVGNIMGLTGAVTADLGYYNGYPNIGNLTYNGTAQPSTGDWWVDWDTTNHRPKSLSGTLTTRTDDTHGIITMSTGLGAEVQTHKTNSGSGSCTLRWPGFTINVVMLGTISGDSVPVTTPGIALPAEGTPIDIWPGFDGFQEFDYDVDGTLLKKSNYYFGTSEIPSAESIGSDTLKNSYFRSSKPSYFGALDWPPFDPTNPASGADNRIPAQQRFSSPAAPVITVDPSSQTVTEGANVTLTAAATGNPAPTWSWTKNGSPISGATSSTLSLTSVTEADEGSYVATATNSEGSDSSTAAVLTVNPSGIPSTNSIRLSRAPLYAATVST